MTDPLPALRTSSNRFLGVLGPLDDQQVAGPSYCDDWTIADVASHLGSGAIISARRIDDALTGETAPDDFNQGVWDEWNAKSPRQKVDDAKVADRAFVDRLESVTPEQRSTFRTQFGPLELDWDGVVGLRLNEHVNHTWDIAVMLDPTATLSPDGAAVVVDNLELVARFGAQPSGDRRTITVGTTDPDRSFAVTIEPESVAFAAVESVIEPDLTMPAEALIRLVYGRLDPDHTPASVTGDPALLDELRRTFPGR